MTGEPVPPAPLPATAPVGLCGALSVLAWLALVGFALATAGAVDPAAAAVVAGFFLLHALLLPGASRADVPRVLGWAVGAALVACVLQLVPLPEGLRAVLAPGPTTARADLRALGLQGSWAPITVDVGATVLEAVLWAGAAAALAVLAGPSGPPLGARVAIGALVALHGLAWLDWATGTYVFPLTHIEDPWGVGQAQLRGTVFSGWLVNRNHWAALGLVLWPLAWGWGWGWGAREARASRLRRGVGSLAAVAVAVAVVTTRSRAGLGVLALQGFALILWAVPRAPRRVRAALGVAIVVAGAALLWGPARAYLERLRAEDVVGRGVLYAATARMAADSPVLGWGLGSFQASFPAYQPEGALYKYSHAHSDPLEWIAGGGVLGVLLVLGLAAGLFRGLRDVRAAALSRAAWALALVGGAAAACVEFPLHIPAVRFVWLGVLFAGPPRARVGALTPPSAPRPSGDGS